MTKYEKALNVIRSIINLDPSAETLTIDEIEKSVEVLDEAVKIASKRVEKDSSRKVVMEIIEYAKNNRSKMVFTKDLIKMLESEYLK